MSDWNRYFARSLVSAALAGALFLQPLRAQGQAPNVRWKAVPGASGYKLQVRSIGGEDILLEERTDENGVYVDLPEGEYEVRAAPLNARGEPVVWSYWRPLRVLRLPAPEIERRGSESSPEYTAQSGEAVYRFTLRGRHLSANTRVELRRAGERIVARVLEVSEDRLEAEADLREAPPGAYDLVVENPPDRRSVAENYLQIREGIPFYEYTFEEYRSYVLGLTRECRTALAPDILVRDCDDFFVTLNLAEQEQTDLFYFLKMIGDNVRNRESAYNYFSESCPPVFRPAREFMERRLEDPDSGAGWGEKRSIRRALDRFDACRTDN